MKVGIDARALLSERTGIGVYTEEIACHLAGLDGVDVELFTPRRVDDRRRIAPGIAFSEDRHRSGTIWLQTHLPRRLARDRCDVLLAALTVAPSHSSVPFVSVVHDLFPLTHPEWHRRKTVLGFLPWIERTIERARRLIAVSRFTASEIERIFPETAGRVVVVANGVDRRFFSAAGASPDQTRAAYTRGRRFVLYLGTLEPRKNLLRLVGACERLWRERRSRPDLLLAGGAGWKSAALLERIARSPFRDKIHRAGYVPDEATPDLYRAAELFCYPSGAEGFGLPLLEAMACGTPVVTSTAPALRETADDAALAADPDDEAGLARLLSRALEDEPLRAELSARGRERASRFDWRRSARETAAVLSEACRS
jgi:glycosyltransferase involved in cell wall biosynthesis